MLIDTPNKRRAAASVKSWHRVALLPDGDLTEEEDRKAIAGTYPVGVFAPPEGVYSTFAADEFAAGALAAEGYGAGAVVADEFVAGGTVGEDYVSGG